MKLQVLSVFDAAAEAFSKPVFVNTIGLAVRGFTQEVNNPQNGDLNKFPHQFILYKLGEWDDANGRFEEKVPPEQICTAESVKT